MDEILNDLYYNNNNYDGIEKLYKKAHEINNKIRKKDIKNYL